jgi:hypothetical protein
MVTARKSKSGRVREPGGFWGGKSGEEGVRRYQSRQIKASPPWKTVNGDEDLRLFTMEPFASDIPFFRVETNRLSVAE